MQKDNSLWVNVPAGVKQRGDTFVNDSNAPDKVVKALQHATDWYFFKTTAGLKPSSSTTSATAAAPKDGGESSDAGVQLETPSTPGKQTANTETASIKSSPAAATKSPSSVSKHGW
jgi:hypothetical protein